jgi:MarR family 2-MHQ and catechol resistance regulon transcriptional repressor
MNTGLSNVTQLVDLLEREGLVVRVAHPTDRRVSFAQLTPEGEHVCTTVLPVVLQFMEGALDGFTIEEKQQLSRLLARMRLNLKREQPAPEDGQSTTSPS